MHTDFTTTVTNIAREAIKYILNDCDPENIVVANTIPIAETIAEYGVENLPLSARISLASAAAPVSYLFDRAFRYLDDDDENIDAIISALVRDGDFETIKDIYTLAGRKLLNWLPDDEILEDVPEFPFMDCPVEALTLAAAVGRYPKLSMAPDCMEYILSHFSSNNFGHDEIFLNMMEKWFILDWEEDSNLYVILAAVYVIERKKKNERETDIVIEPKGELFDEQKEALTASD